MLLIADSGGTKTTWAFVVGTHNVQFIETKGIHPYFQNRHEISEIIQELPRDWRTKATQLQFYGAGCGAKEQAMKVEEALKEHFPKKPKIEVQVDILAAARALCQHSEGIAAILGTGSNACHYDGEKIVEISRGFGFILGDEGSGAVMGKRLIEDYLYHKMPLHLLQKLEETHQLTPDKVLKQVYQQPAPNRYLAQFSYFIHAHRHETYLQELLKSHFGDFFRRRILVFESHQRVPLHLMGSIAFHFQEEIKQAAAQFSIHLGSVLQNPIEGLVAYHLTDSYPSFDDKT